MGARPYDPVLGRFLGVDPVEGGALNNYDYAGQDPMNGYDLDGTACAPCGAVAVVVVVRGVQAYRAYRAAQAAAAAAAAARAARLAAGRARHHAVRDEIYDKLVLKHGSEYVRREAGTRTALGLRIHDIRWTDPRTGRMYAIEVKTGAARYGGSQAAKDALVRFNVRVVRRGGH